MWSSWKVAFFFHYCVYLFEMFVMHYCNNVKVWIGQITDMRQRILGNKEEFGEFTTRLFFMSMTWHSKMCLICQMGKHFSVLVLLRVWWIKSSIELSLPRTCCFVCFDPFGTCSLSRLISAKNCSVFLEFSRLCSFFVFQEFIFGVFREDSEKLFRFRWKVL